MRISTRSASRFLLIAGLITVFASGCSSKNSGVGSLGGEATGISTTLDELNENKGSAKKASELFAKGASMPDASKLRAYSYSLRGSNSASGNSANLKVSVYDERGGKEAGEFDWSFEKEGDRWKIKTATLP